MKLQLLWALPTMALLAFASCSNDDTIQGNNEQLTEETTGMTEFAVEESPRLGKAATRTMGIYNGSAIDFYWTAGDTLWINSGSGTSPLIKNSKNNISGKTATAKFYFTGTYTAESYPVRYTGNGKTVGDKVTIKSKQEQKDANDGSHIGTDGDCGTATATKDGGRYRFTLSHKASYITFIPYYSHGFADAVKVTQIKVTADEALAGEFSFNDNGIDLASRPSANPSNQSITLNLNGDGLNGFPVPTEPKIDKNAAIIVLAPGIYNNFTVEYTLHDSETLVTGTVTKNYGTLTFREGKNKRVAADLGVPHYSSDIYYMWDAAVNQHAWKGHEDYQPILNGQANLNHYPKNASDPRWYNPLSFPASAARSAKDCPNANELRWYAEKGTPHWDPSIWCIMKHLYQGGMWLKKRSVIAAENHKSPADLKQSAPDGTNFTATSSNPKLYEKFEYDNKTITLGKPDILSNYIFLPVFGYYLTGHYSGKDLKPSELRFIGQRGYYWSSTPRPDMNLNGYNIYVARDRVHTGYGDRQNAHCLWPE